MMARYRHGNCCEHQKLVGSHERYDVYVCFATKTVVIRFGDQPTDRRWVDTYFDEESNTYKLCGWSRASFDELTGAAKRAMVVGLIELAKQVQPKVEPAAVGDGDALERLT